MKGLKLVVALMTMGTIFTGQFAGNTKAATVVSHEGDVTTIDETTVTNYQISDKTPNQYVTARKIALYQNYHKKATGTLNRGATLKLVKRAGKDAWVKVMANRRFKKTYYVKDFSQQVYSTKRMTLSQGTKKAFLSTAKQWSKHLTATQKKALIGYTGSDYTDINGYLRGTEKNVSAKYRNASKQISAALGNFSLNNAMTYYRGTSLNAINYGLPSRKLAVGSEYFDRGFSSATVDPAIAYQFQNGAIMQFNIPANKRVGAYIAALSSSPQEQEYLINHGKKFVVTKIGRVKMTIKDTVTVKKKGKITYRQTYTMNQTCTLVVVNLI